MVQNIAQDYLIKARTSFHQAEECLKVFDRSTSISRALECIEFALKSALLALGKTYSYEHRVDGALKSAYPDFPEWFKEKVARFALISEITSRFRSRAAYGDLGLNTPAKDLFSDYEAKAYVEDAREVLQYCERLFYETKYKKEQGR
jgi:HEPN domain-containing protein